MAGRQSRMGQIIVMPLTVKTKDWAAGRRWARRNAIATPGVTYTLLRDGRQLSYRYEDGLMYCTGHGKRVEPYHPGLAGLTASEPMC